MLRLLFISLSLFVTLSAVDRCERYVQDVRRYHYEAFGINYPYWYGVGQLKQESQCRDVISTDGVGSQGVSQITYKLWKPYLKQLQINDLTSIRNQIKAQAYIMKSCKQKAVKPDLWITYQIYNGGTLVNQEIQRAQKNLKKKDVTHDESAQYCRRRIVHFSNGSTLNACDINYDYSIHIYQYGQRYRLSSQDEIKFW